jgi:hypothetical protein
MPGPLRAKTLRRRPGEGTRQVLIRAGRAVIRARLLETPTADRLWRTLPIYSSAEIWGRCVRFETHVETGRETAAKALVAPGEIAFQSEDDRVVMAYGATPISRPGELRLASPCNVWAVALDPLDALKSVKSGDQVAVIAVE